MEKKQQSTSLALMTLSFLTLASSAVSPALASVGQAYPDVPKTMISLLTTLPSLLAVPMTLLCGQVAGRTVSYRKLALAGLVCNMVSGIAPAFTSNFYLLLFWRALFGCGTGILTPLIMPAMMATFQGEEVHKQASRNAAATNIGAVLFQMFGGIACARWGWQTTFLIYVIIAPAILLVAKIFPEPPPPTDGVTRASSGQMRPIYKWCAVYFVHMVLFYVAVTETSDVVRQSGYGTAGTAAVILSVITLAGVGGGLLYKQINRWGIPLLVLAYSNLAAGYLVMALCPNVLVMGLGAALVGIGFGINMPALQVYVGQAVPGQIRAAASSVLAVFGSMGGFLSKFILAFLGARLGFDGGRGSFLVCVVGYLLLSGIFVICAVWGKKAKLRTEKV